MTALKEIQRAFLERVDTEYSYRLAKSIEQFRTNPVLGYRTAGSEAEFQTGEMLFQEMKRIGLSDVTKDAFTLDTWEFRHARLSFGSHQFELGGYQTNFSTGGKKPFTVIYGGRGTERDLEGLDVRGKLVLVDINQRDDWWISYPVYEAHLRGAAAVIAVQNNGYGEVDSTALNAQNICSIADAPAFSLSQADARVLRRHLAKCGGEAPVLFDAESHVGFNGVSYNIVGKIPGRDPDAMLLMSAHYDSYFAGFQDDNAAVALMMGIAKALLETGFQPEKTLVFCAMAAEEWGVSNSKYDWSAGAYSQIFRVHPEWVGKVEADINFELPAYAHDTQDIIRCVYEYETYLTAFARALPDVTHLYPDGVGVACPVQTWSDDFSMAIAGVPSLVNDFAGGSFMETHYHSQFDNDDAYEEHIYRFHHELYGTLMLAYDRCAVTPLDFSPRLDALRDSIDRERMEACGADCNALLHALQTAKTQAELCWEQVRALNHRHARLLDEGNTGDAALLRAQARELNRALLAAYKHCEDSFVRLTWHDDVIFPHEYAQQNLTRLAGACKALSAGDAEAALWGWIAKIDTNWYAGFFDLETCRHFVDYVLHQPDERLMWGAGRIPGLCELFGTVKSLLAKLPHTSPEDDFSADLTALEAARQTQEKLLVQIAGEETRAVQTLSRMLSELPAFPAPKNREV